ncbi:MAG TPA: WcaF family extracellular polysaccharide biosynthesis acetyltransferase [Segetibacter sp.]
MKADLASFNNNWYQPGSSFKRVSWLIIQSLFFNHSLAVFNGLKCFLIKAFGGKVGTGVIIKPSVKIKYPWFLEIGDHCWIGENVWIDNLAKVTIGNNVCLSQGSFLLTGNHDYKKTTFDLIIAEIILEDGVWLGAKSVVCPGVTCKTHSVLSVGSVATKTLEAYSIYQGIPAAKIKERIILN